MLRSSFPQKFQKGPLSPSLSGDVAFFSLSFSQTPLGVLWEKAQVVGGILFLNQATFSKGCHLTHTGSTCPISSRRRRGQGGISPFPLSRVSTLSCAHTLEARARSAFYSKRRCNDFPKCLYEHWHLLVRTKLSHPALEREGRNVPYKKGRT